MTAKSSHNGDIVKQTLESIGTNFYNYGLYKLYKNKNLFCIHVNGLVNVGLSEFGDKIVTDNIDNVLSSNLFSQTENLFVREINADNEITVFSFNVCKNALALLSMIADNRIELANKIVDTLYCSPLFEKISGLFYREMNSVTKQLNKLTLSQTNLWMVIALSKLLRVKQATLLMESIERNLFDQNVGMFFSQDCELEPGENDGPLTQEKLKSFFSDDQALAAIAYYSLGQSDKARAIIDKILNSDLFDKETGMFNRNIDSRGINPVKTTYKNALMCIALNLLGYADESKKVQDGLVDRLYDKKDKLFNFSDVDSLKIPDNSILALIALSQEKIRHVIF